MFSLYDALESIRQFVASGGPVLYGIGGLTFFMWTLVFERIWYFRFVLPGEVVGVVNAWEQRAERASWNARQVRRALVSRTRKRSSRTCR